MAEQAPEDKPLDLDDVEMICGVPVMWLENFDKTLDRPQRRAWRKIFGVMEAFQQQLDDAMDDDGLTSIFLEIDRTEKDLTIGYRKKLKAAISKIDPRLMKANIELGLRMGLTAAAQQLSNIMALPVDAKAKAQDDRPPSVAFSYESIEDDEDFDTEQS